jgi:hypothetical protein
VGHAHKILELAKNFAKDKRTSLFRNTVVSEFEKLFNIDPALPIKK